MASSDCATSNQNSNTASEIQTETVTGSHLFTVTQYSLTKGIGVGKCLKSDFFVVGGYKWTIKYYPDGDLHQSGDFMSLFLERKREGADVKVQYSFTIVGRNGQPSNMNYTSPAITFSSTSTSDTWGANKFVKKAEFEGSEYLKDDTFRMKCTITIIKGRHLKATRQYGVSVPPSNLKQNYANLLETGVGHDVTLVVKGVRFKAHRCVLAARSAVFRAEFFGCMKEKWTDTVTIDDIEAPVFKDMLRFIYSDSLLEFEVTNIEDSKIHDLSLMAQHLLVAADRYALERLKLMCEDVLCKNLCASNAATSLILADQNNCSQLKAECIRFISPPEVFKAVAKTEEFQILLKRCPSFLKDI